MDVRMTIDTPIARITSAVYDWLAEGHVSKVVKGAEFGTWCVHVIFKPVANAIDVRGTGTHIKLHPIARNAAAQPLASTRQIRFERGA